MLINNLKWNFVKFRIKNFQADERLRAMNYKKIYNSRYESLGIGLTSNCNLSCSHCYSKYFHKDTLPLNKLKRIIDFFPNLKKVNFGTGESIFNPDILDIINFFSSKNIRMALTTNGTTVKELPDEYLKKIDEFDISIDFPNKKMHDAWRKRSGLFDLAIQAIEKSKSIGADVSIATVLMHNNYLYFKKFRDILDRYKIYLRVNLYKPVHTKKFQLTYSEFWQAIKTITENFFLVSNSEPILSLIDPIMNKFGPPCGDLSLRIHPDLSISACVYTDSRKISVDDFIRFKKEIPEFCKACYAVKYCRGGCVSRRIYNNSLNKPDIYCPLYRNKEVPHIEFIDFENKEFIHSNYLCTFILR